MRACGGGSFEACLSPGHLLAVLSSGPRAGFKKFLWHKMYLALFRSRCYERFAMTIMNPAAPHTVTIHCCIVPQPARFPTLDHCVGGNHQPLVVMSPWEDVVVLLRTGAGLMRSGSIASLHPRRGRPGRESNRLQQCFWSGPSGYCYCYCHWVIDLLRGLSRARGSVSGHQSASTHRGASGGQKRESHSPAQM
jgi:hypothetical protein